MRRDPRDIQGTASEANYNSKISLETAGHGIQSKIGCAWPAIKIFHEADI